MFRLFFVMAKLEKIMLENDCPGIYPEVSGLIFMVLRICYDLEITKEVRVREIRI